MSPDPPDRPGYLRLLPPPANTRAPSGDRLDDVVGYLILVVWNIDAGRFEIRAATQQSPPLKRRYLPWVHELLNRIGDAEIAEATAAEERAKLAVAPAPEPPEKTP
jgi:hypothetical protein